MSWTEDRVEVLRKLWLDGFSASQIAKQLGGGLTRNAVIGKVHRLGLSGRAAPSQPQRPAYKPTRPNRTGAPAPAPLAVRPAMEAPAAPPAAPVPPAVLRCEESGSATVLTLGSHQCKWPIGDPTSSEFSFCGKATGEGPYCAQHAQVAYQAPPRRTPGKRSETAELVRSLRRYI